jgi:hypothetical protein
VLTPGGLLLFETPNPTNLTVGARDFYLDPTHCNPLHPETMRFLAERQGLVRVSVLPLHPSPPELRLPDDGTLVVQRVAPWAARLWNPGTSRVTPWSTFTGWTQG